MGNNHIMFTTSLFLIIWLILGNPCSASIHYDEIIDSSDGYPTKKYKSYHLRESDLKFILINEGETKFYSELKQALRNANSLALLDIIDMHNKVRFKKKVNPYKVIRISGREPFQDFIRAWSARSQYIIDIGSVSEPFLYQLPKIYKLLKISPDFALVNGWERESRDHLTFERILECMRYWITSCAEFSSEFIFYVVSRAERKLNKLSLDALGHYLHVYNWYGVEPSMNLIAQLNKEMNFSESRKSRFYQNTLNALQYTYLYWGETYFNQNILALIHKQLKALKRSKTTISQFQRNVATYIIDRFNREISMEEYLPDIGHKVDIIDETGNLFEVDGMTHFVRYIGLEGCYLLYNDKSELTTKLMKRRGYSVYRIAFKDWDRNKDKAFRLF